MTIKTKAAPRAGIKSNIGKWANAKSNKSNTSETSETGEVNEVPVKAAIVNMTQSVSPKANITIRQEGGDSSSDRDISLKPGEYAIVPARDFLHLLNEADDNGNVPDIPHEIDGYKANVQLNVGFRKTSERIPISADKDFILAAMSKGRPAFSYGGEGPDGRKIYLVDTGDMPPAKAQAYLAKIKEELRQSRIPLQDESKERKSEKRKQEMWTQSDVDDLRACMEPLDGLRSFISKGNFKVRHPLRGEIAWEPYSYQWTLLDQLFELGSYERGGRGNGVGYGGGYIGTRESLIGLWGRQLGKTVTMASYILHRAIMRRDQTILIGTNKEANTLDIMGKIKFAYENLPDKLKPVVKTYNAKSIRFENGSQIVAEGVSETTGRGMSISLLYLDEFANVPEGIARNFWASMSPTLASGGQCVIMSSSGRNPLFWELWDKSRVEYATDDRPFDVSSFIKWSAAWDEMDPVRDDAWRAKQISLIGKERFEAEHECRRPKDIANWSLVGSEGNKGNEGGNERNGGGYGPYYYRPGTPEDWNWAPAPGVVRPPYVNPPYVNPAPGNPYYINPHVNPFPVNPPPVNPPVPGVGTPFGGSTPSSAVQDPVANLSQSSED